MLSTLYFLLGHGRHNQAHSHHLKSTTIVARRELNRIENICSTDIIAEKTLRFYDINHSVSYLFNVSLAFA